MYPSSPVFPENPYVNVVLAVGMCPKGMLLYCENYVSLQLQPSEGMD